MVVVDTNVTPGRDFDTLRVRVEDDASTEIAYRYGWDAAAQRAIVKDGGALPFTLNVQNARDGLAERQVSVTAWKAGVPVFVRDARLVLPASGTKLLRMPVEALCFPSLAAEGARPVARPERDWAIACAEGETCFGGSCASAHVDATKLEEYAPEVVFGGATGSGQGGECVDALACFTRRSKADGSLDESRLAQVVDPVQVAGECTLNVELLRGRDDFVIGVELPGTLGACGASGCVGILDRVADPSREVGWRADGGRVYLPPAVCDKLLRVFVRVTTDEACAVKEPSRPACGEARSVGLSAKPSNRAGEPFALEGGGQGAVVCAVWTPSRELCERSRVACGNELAEDSRCAVPSPFYVATRYAQCRGVGESTVCASDDTAGMRRIPGGRFLMGSTENEILGLFAELGSPRSDAFDSELPQHPVAVREFWLDTTEVTVDAYAECVAEGKCTPADEYDPASGYAKRCNARRPGYGSHPINCVDWAQAVVYCAVRGKRLPTEEEWEYAARGGAKQYAYPWGNESPKGDTRLCWSGDTARSGTCAVGSFSPAGDSAEGVKDLAGNVEEWTSSPSSAGYSMFRTTAARAVRGGGWFHESRIGVRAARRASEKPSVRAYSLGFRCAR